MITMWYPTLDRFRTKYYEVIVNIAKEIDMAQQYLGNVYVLKNHTKLS